MSRVGKKEIVIPDGVKVTVEANNFVTVKGPKGELTHHFSPLVKIEEKDNKITLTRVNELRETVMIHGTSRAILANMIKGAHEEFVKKLEIQGVGYRAQVQGRTLVLTMGFSHPVNMPIPEGVNVECPKPTLINISGANKEVVGQFAANIRDIRKPEPYLGKGIRYEGEHVRHKAGKTAK